MLKAEPDLLMCAVTVVSYDPPHPFTQTYYENFYPAFLQNFTHRARSGDVALGNYQPPKGHRSPTAAADRGRPAMPQSDPLPIQDLPVLHQGKERNAPFVFEHRTP